MLHPRKFNFHTTRVYLSKAFFTLVVQPFFHSPCPQKLAHILRFQERFVVKQCFVHLLIRVHSLLAYFLLTIVIYSKLRILINKTSMCGNHKVHTVSQ